MLSPLSLSLSHKIVTQLLFSSAFPRNTKRTPNRNDGSSQLRQTKVRRVKNTFSASTSFIRPEISAAGLHLSTDFTAENTCHRVEEFFSFLFLFFLLLVELNEDKEEEEEGKRKKETSSGT